MIMKNFNASRLFAAVLLLVTGSLTAQVNINIPTYTVAPDDNVFVDVTVDDFTDIISCQFSLNWDPNVIDFFNVTDLDFQYLSTGSFNLSQTEEGRLSMVWTDASATVDGVTVDDGTLMFRMIFKAVGGAGTQSEISFTDDPTPIEIADNTATILTPEFQIGMVTVEGSTAVGDLSDNTTLTRLDAQPNPFVDQTTLHLHFAHAAPHTTLRIFALDGTLLHTEQRAFPAGAQQLTLPAERFPAAGGYLIQLSNTRETIQEIVLKK